MPWYLALVIRLVAFTAVFWLATRPRREKGVPKDKAAIRPSKITIQPRWAIPLVGVVFALMNVGLYWLLRPVLDLATLRTFSLVTPFVVNALLLWGTARVVEKKQWLKIDGFVAAAWLAGVLTLAHGVLWLALDYLPAL